MAWQDYFEHASDAEADGWGEWPDQDEQTDEDEDEAS